MIKILSKFLLGFVPFDLFVTVLAPCGTFNMDLGRFSHVHCPHVMYSVAYKVFDKMLKWHFSALLDSNEFQMLGFPMIEFVYHVLIIGCVFYTL